VCHPMQAVILLHPPLPQPRVAVASETVPAKPLFIESERAEYRAEPMICEITI